MGRPAVRRLDESIWTWLRHAAGMASQLCRGLPTCRAGGVLQPSRSVKDLIGLAIAEQAGSDRADIMWRSASVGVLINEGWKAELPAWWVRILATLLRPLNEALGGRQPPAAVAPSAGRPPGRTGLSERPQAGGPTQGRSRLRYQIPMEIASRPVTVTALVDDSAARS